MAENTCSACGLDAHEDDRLQVVQTPAGMAHACRACRRALGDAAATDPVYGPGAAVPTIHDGMQTRHVRVCGLCRKALRFSDPDKAVRVTAEDLDEGFQAEYAARIAPALTAFRAAVDAAEKAYADEMRPYIDGRDRQLTALEFERSQAVFGVQADTQADFDEKLKAIDQQFARDCNLLDDIFRADTAYVKGARDAARFRASRAYQAAALAAYKACQTRSVPTCEPGCYGMCRVCLEKYKPRIRERNIRNFVHHAHEQPGDHYLL